ncbi:AAA family ATPase [Fusobacterium periodonticum]|uniref:McrB family protein n=1 Tax=Fusobacterium periodonticum TaxID=860 RepID=UPI0028D83223|nr:AAA family ATPase [Fusobacterium periodonticum]
MEEIKETQERLNKKNLSLIFAWDPEESKWTAEKYKEACLKVKNAEKYLIRDWKCGRKDEIEKGTEVFIIKVGAEPKGIIGHGYIKTLPTKKYDEDKKWWVDIEFDKLLDYENEKILKTEDLIDKLSEQNWKNGIQNPGTKIKETVVPRLRKMWSKLINGDENSENLNRGDEKETMKKEFDKNVIFYGPPGTGKTYTTAKRAVEICKTESEKELTDYSEIMKKYNELKKKNRIEFITFHQSYGYEEFIEGIKPIVLNEDDESEDESENNKESKTNIKIENDIKYDVVDGIFKKFCDNARKAIIETNNNDIPLEAIVWKVTVRGQVREECFNNNHVRIDWNFDDTGAVGFVEEVKKGDIIITTDGSRTRINGIAVVTDDKGYTLDKEERDTTTRNVKWLATNIDENIKSINKEKMLQRRTVARVPNMKVEDIIKLAKEKNPTALSKIDIKENKEPYVFIIDEINRGNISKIFGELITLIETTKRSGEGKEECISTKLPYSNEEFTVPDNVYIIGTMNTADRSIALMDTALRRRFKFEEMLPNYHLLKDIFVEDEGVKVNIGAMLKAINERIEYLYDREHTIGHAVFLELKENNNIDKLENIFKKSVIPLLQEYFYEDYEKIRIVLGDNAKDEDEQFISAVSIPEDIFEGDIGDIDIPEKKYIIKYENFRNIMAYKNISKKLSDE